MDRQDPVAEEVDHAVDDHCRSGKLGGVYARMVIREVRM